MYRLLSRVRVKRYSNFKDDQGGIINTISSFWDKYAEVKDRSSSFSFSKGQDKAFFTHRVVLRYEASRPTKSNDVISYSGYNHKIVNISIKSELGKRYEIIDCTRIDQNINQSNPVETDNIKIYNYTATGTESEFTASELIGANIVGMFKDGSQFMQVDSDIFSSNKKEAYHNPSSGRVAWSVPFEAGQDAMIQYY